MWNIKKLLRNFEGSNESIFKKLWGLKVEVVSYKKRMYRELGASASINQQSQLKNDHSSINSSFFLCAHICETGGSSTPHFSMVLSVVSSGQYDNSGGKEQQWESSQEHIIDISCEYFPRNYILFLHHHVFLEDLRQGFLITQHDGGVDFVDMLGQGMSGRGLNSPSCRFVGTEFGDFTVHSSLRSLHS